MKKFIFPPLQSIDKTPDEPWTMIREERHQYAANSDFTLEKLGKGPGKCLVIGSAVFEVLELVNAGWTVTYVDVRKPPLVDFEFIHGDASTLDLGEEKYDAAASDCVLCHAGMGRYGDKISLDAPRKIVQNIHRALKPGALASICIGTVASINESLEVGSSMRIFTLEVAHELMKDFTILEEKLYDGLNQEWKTGSPSTILNQDYLMMLLKKC